MKKKYILTALASTTLVSNAVVIATTSFETADNFAAGNNQTIGFSVTADDGASWVAGPIGNFAGTWTGQNLTGAQAAVLGNTTRFMTVDAAGSAGVTTVDFSWERYTASTGNFEVQWTTDTLNGSEAWTTAATINKAGSAGGGWISETVNINQAGDVKLRWINTTGNGGQSFDDITVNAVPEPSTTALFGLAGLALILRRRK